jgi:hypothetical protein
MLYKICRIIHKETNKIEFAFFLFLYDFLRILQDAAKGLTLFKNLVFTKVPGKFSTSQKCPCFTLRPLGIKLTLQLGPWGGAAAVRPNSGEADDRGRPGAGRGRPGVS